MFDFSIVTQLDTPDADFRHAGRSGNIPRMCRDRRVHHR